MIVEMGSANVPSILEEMPEDNIASTLSSVVVAGFPRLTANLLMAKIRGIIFACTVFSIQENGVDMISSNVGNMATPRVPVIDSSHCNTEGGCL